MTRPQRLRRIAPERSNVGPHVTEASLDICDHARPNPRARGAPRRRTGRDGRRRWRELGRLSAPRWCQLALVRAVGDSTITFSILAHSSSAALT